jgi:phosphotriesterase-related protein
LVERGYLEQIMLSHDNSCFYDVQPMHELEFPAYTEIVVDFIPKLKGHGITDEQVAEIMVGNPRRLFATAAKGGY